MRDKLKPCPFCGGEAGLAIVKLWNHVYCNSCHARTTMYSSEEQAIDAWNTRANPWHTGTPTEKGWYLLALTTKVFNDKPFCVAYMDGHHWLGINDFYIFVDDVVAWQKIEPYKGKEDGNTD